MDFRLKGRVVLLTSYIMRRFNPCSNGLSAQRVNTIDLIERRIFVSILVLMDFRLKA